MELSRINKEWVKVNFSDDFSWNKVNAVKKIPGRDYQPDSEDWHIPLNTRENAAKFLSFCNEFGVDTLPDQIENMIKELREEFEEERKREETNRTLATGAKSSLDRVYGTAKGMQLREYQRAAVEYIEKNERVIIGDEMGLGKAQPLDAKVLTPEGWKKMRDIQPGDKVIGRDGNPTKVTGVYPQGEKEIYEITFSHGAKTRACGEHLWHVQTNNGRNRGYHKIKTTEELIGDLRYNGENKNKKWFAPLIKEPVKFDRSEEYNIDPYALGLLIGDGSLRKEHIRFSSQDEQLVEELETSLPEKTSLSHASGYDYNVTYGERTEENIVQSALREGGLLKNSEHKFVPDKYKYGTPQVRLAVLQGLFDTDGSIQGSGVTFSSASKELSEDVQEMVRSLGGTASLHTCEATYTYNGKKKKGQDRHRVYAKLPLDMEPFRLDRKKEKLQDPQGPPCRTIESIEKVGTEEAQCISVEAGDSLYVTDDYVVTHNTVEAIGAVQHLDAYPVLCVVPAAVRSHWEKEWNTWIPRRAVKTIKSGNHTDFRGSVNIVTYSLVYKFTEKFKEKDFGAIICDESHKLKNNSAKRSKAVRKISKGIPYRILLTGTPVINQPSEIINQLKILGVFKDTFGGWMQFTERYCNRQESQFGRWDISGASNLDELHERLTGNCYVRRNKEDDEILDELPDKQRTTVELEIDNRSKYEDVEENLADHLRKKYKNDDEFRKQIEHLSEPLKEAHMERHAEARVRRAMNAEHLVKINELRQVTSQGKYKEAKNWIRNFTESGEPLLLFAHYTDTTEALAEEFGCPKITGSVDADRRGEIVEEFQNGEHDLLVLNIQAGGVGITLTEASNVAFVEIPWTWAETVQAEDRTHRIGQEDSVNVYFLLAEDTIDEWMWELINKKKMITDVVNKGISTEEVEQKTIEAGIVEKVMEKHDI